MEDEVKSVKPPQQQLPNPTITTPQNPQPPHATARPPLHSSNKRKTSDNVDTQHAHYYFKLCALVKDLRPHFIEVLRTPDFRNSKAAYEIRKKMKHVMDVCKQMSMETASIEMFKKPFEGQSLPGENKDGQKLVDKPEEQQGKRHRPDHFPEKSAELPLDGSNAEILEDPQVQGSYVVGGSNFGWNFIMYPGNKAVYYGVTKESRRILKKKMNISGINSK